MAESLYLRNFHMKVHAFAATVAEVVVLVSVCVCVSGCEKHSLNLQISSPKTSGIIETLNTS